MHDWSDKYCNKILTLLRQAAGPSTQLIIMDNIISYASPQCTIPEEIPGETIPIPPEPLLPNWGEANIMPYLADMQMLTALNGSERTVAQYNRIFEASGWKLAQVYSTWDKDSNHRTQNSSVCRTHSLRGMRRHT